MSEAKRVRLAFVTESGEKVDTGFEIASEIVVCEVTPEASHEVAVLRYEIPALIRASGMGGGCGAKKDPCGGEKKSGGCGGGKKKEDVLDENAVENRIQALNGAAVLFTLKTLHAYSALALNHAKVFSVKLDEPQYIADIIQRVQEMLALNPPLWLQRSLYTEQQKEIIGKEV
jgi:hypothetical protein